MSDERRHPPEEEKADGSNYREDDDTGSPVADGSNYRDDDPQDHPLHEDRVDPDGVLEDAEEQRRRSERGV